MHSERAYDFNNGNKIVVRTPALPHCPQEIGKVAMSADSARWWPCKRLLGTDFGKGPMPMPLGSGLVGLMPCQMKAPGQGLRMVL